MQHFAIDHLCHSIIVENIFGIHNESKQSWGCFRKIYDCLILQFARCKNMHKFKYVQCSFSCTKLQEEVAERSCKDFVFKVPINQNKKYKFNTNPYYPNIFSIGNNFLLNNANSFIFFILQKIIPKRKTHLWIVFLKTIEVCNPSRYRIMHNFWTTLNLETFKIIAIGIQDLM